MRDEEIETRRTRLGALKALGAATAGIAAGAFIGKDTNTAAAATGSNVVAGMSTTAQDQTKLTMDGTPPANTSAFVVQAPNASAAIEGNSSSIGVLGNATTGVMGIGNVGGVFSGDANAIQLNPQTFTGAPSSGAHLKGDMLVDAAGSLWLCVADGTPGTWVNVAGGGVQLMSQPQRAYDSRLTGGILHAGSTRVVPIIGATDSLGNPLTVPAQASGVVCNLTVTGTTNFGFLQAWPDGQRPALGSNVNWGGAGLTVANAATVGVGSDGSIRLYVEASDTHVIVDVSAYIL